MTQAIQILETLLADAAAGRPAALCVVVRTRGSTPQSPGAMMLLRADMSTLGTLGGGCVEAEVRKRAFERLQHDGSGVLAFTLDHDYGWDDGLICGGRMSVAVRPVAVADAAPFRDALDLAKRRRPAAFPLIVEAEGKPAEYRVHIEVAPTLLIAGAGHVGCALAKLCAGLDFHVVVLDDRGDLA
ncbi:MAG: hypothetical protein HZB38_09105, partial [Planctomycetes bacterium]|nr:hypothetical protein [Planctomycetota bacterium]